MIRKILAATAVIALLAMAGCGQNEEKSSAEKAGESMDKAIESTKEAAHHAADAVSEATARTTEQARELAHDSLEATEQTIHKARESMEKKE